MTETITIKKQDLWKYSTFVLLAVVVIMAFVMFSGSKSTENTTAGTTPTTTTTTNNQQQLPAQIAQVSIGNSPVIGDKNAPVTVIEFSDFSCPYCEAASGDNAQMTASMKQRSPSWEPIVTNLMNDYVKTGKVRFAYKYSMGHTGGKPASSVGWCLNDQSSDLFWKYYPLVFASASADTEDMTKMQALAKSVGADMTKLQACLDSKKFDSRFASEQAEGVAAHVQGTPAFFVNGQLVEGAQPYSNVKTLIDQALAGK